MIKKSFNCSLALRLFVALLLQIKFISTAAFSVISAPAHRFLNSNQKLIDTRIGIVVYSTPSPSSDDDGVSSTQEQTKEEEKVSAVGNLVDGVGSTLEQTKEEEKASAVGNLVENDEWEGLTMELSEVIQMAVGKS